MVQQEKKIRRENNKANMPKMLTVNMSEECSGDLCTILIAFLYILNYFKIKDKVETKNVV